MTVPTAPELARQLADVLEPAGVPYAIGGALALDEALASARTRGDFKLWWRGMRADVFVASIAFYDSVRSRIRRAPLEGRPAWFLSPEDLAVFKLLFYRVKDILDIERMVAFMGPAFDRGYVRHWLIALVGPDDERVGRWDALIPGLSG